jgi:hypothetical protein
MAHILNINLNNIDMVERKLPQSISNIAYVVGPDNQLSTATNDKNKSPAPALAALVSMFPAPVLAVLPVLLDIRVLPLVQLLVTVSIPVVPRVSVKVRARVRHPVESKCQPERCAEQQSKCIPQCLSKQQSSPSSLIAKFGCTFTSKSSKLLCILASLYFGISPFLAFATV